MLAIVSPKHQRSVSETHLYILLLRSTHTIGIRHTFERMHRAATFEIKQLSGTIDSRTLFVGVAHTLHLLLSS